jgi:hypothetical protein
MPQAKRSRPQRDLATIHPAAAAIDIGATMHVAAVAPDRLRLQLREQPTAAGDIVLLYGDEGEALTHPYLARAWAKSGVDLRVPAPGQAKKVAMLGSLKQQRLRGASRADRCTLWPDAWPSGQAGGVGRG